MKTLILGNAGSGKSTYAKRIAADTGAQPLCLDAVAFAGSTERRPIAESIANARAFTDQHHHWVIEGCYADLAQALSDQAETLIFLNPGVDVCIAHCRARPWEPDKFESADTQAAHLEALMDWVRQYPDRDDEYGLAQHRAVFDAFTGDKREFTDPAHYVLDAQ